MAKFTTTLLCATALIAVAGTVAAFGVLYVLRRLEGPLRFAVVAMALIALLAPWVAPYDPDAQDVIMKLEPPSAEHWFGTDAFGRDVLSRVIWGARVSLFVGTVATLAGVLIGTIIGIVSGYYGGVVDKLITAATDVLVTASDWLQHTYHMFV